MRWKSSKKYRFWVPALQKVSATKGSTDEQHQYWKPAVNRQPGYRWGGSKSQTFQISSFFLHFSLKMSFLMYFTSLFRPIWISKQSFQVISRCWSFSSMLMSLIRPKSESFQHPEVFWKLPSYTAATTKIMSPRSPQRVSFRNCSSSHYSSSISPA